MDRLSQAYGRVLDGLMLIACLLLLGMTLLIGADVVTRNLGLGGIAWSGEVSEDILYLLTLLAAPWLLRQGQHIRVDILLRALPARTGWLLEWVGDVVGLACSLYFIWYGYKVVVASYQAGAVTIKTLVTPEWWLLVPLPVAFVLFAIEFVFRMHRLSRSQRTPRADAVSAT
jgi:TRAP-type C4-dicarboxylate transport system permease small subunit